MKDNFRIDFIGVGVPKCATTYLTVCLDEHPEICLPKLNKLNELNYFSRTRAENTKSEYEFNGLKGYKKFFNHCDFSDKKIKIGEMSTQYSLDPRAAKIIKKNFPKVKLIVSLRDPVERAFSDYLMHKNYGTFENKEFIDALNESKKKPFSFNYYYKSLYYKQLKPYYNLFPKKNIKIVFSEDIKKNPGKVIKGIYNFLGVDSSFVPPSLLKKANTATKTRFKLIRKSLDCAASLAQLMEKIGFGKHIAWTKRKFRLDILIPKINNLNTKKYEKERLDEEIKKKVKKCFIKDIEKLEKLIGKDLYRWK